MACHRYLTDHDAKQNKKLRVDNLRIPIFIPATLMSYISEITHAVWIIARR